MRLEALITLGVMNMKIHSSIIAMLLGYALLFSNPAGAATISVSCQLNLLPPPSTPYENANCTYSWVSTGNPQALNGRMQTTLTTAPGGSSPPGVLLDMIDTGQFAFSQRTSPFETWIACGTGGPRRVQMNGYSLRFILNCSSCPGYWQNVQALIDAAHPYITNPVACP